MRIHIYFSTGNSQHSVYVTLEIGQPYISYFEHKKLFTFQWFVIKMYVIHNTNNYCYSRRRHGPTDVNSISFPLFSSRPIALSLVLSLLILLLQLRYDPTSFAILVLLLLSTRGDDCLLFVGLFVLFALLCFRCSSLSRARFCSITMKSYVVKPRLTSVKWNRDN